MEYIRNLFEQNDGYQSVQEDEILANLDNLNIGTISLKKEEIMEYKGKITKEVYTTKEYPFLIKENKFSSNNTLYINPDYYVENQEKVDYLLSEIVKKTTTKEFRIENQTLITKNIINALSKSNTIDEVSLAMYGENKYILTKEDYDILKQSSIKKVKTSAVSEELKENFDPLISYNADRNLIGYNVYKNLSDEQINVSKKITKGELENLKYLQNSNSKILIKEENMEDAILIVKRLKELGKKNHVVIEVKNKEAVTEKILSTNNYLSENIDIQINSDTISIKEYMRFEKILYQMIEPSKNLSPFERYIYAYNVVKQYKQYKENNEKPSAARNLYAILENEYMVCVGYSHMLEDLLNKSEIKSIDRSVEVDVSYDKFDENEVVSSTKGGHARRYIYLNDQKYGIDGFYIADPTWDNDLEKDLYNHLLLTGKEEDDTRRYNFTSTSIYSSFSELMNIESLEELYQKINFYLDRNPQKNLSDILRNLTEKLKKLSPNFIQKLEEKYPEMKISYMSWPKEKEILYDIAQYIITKVNKPVSGETIMYAVNEVYQKAYHLEGEELQNKLFQTLEVNKNMQHLSFPKRYKTDEYGNKIELPSISDKFDIEISTYHK